MGQITSLLHDVQCALKVPKDQWNNFGKYPYRNAEGILQSVKALLPEGAAVMCDTRPEFQVIDGKAHVVCIAKAELSAGDEKVAAYAYAVEPLEKKGMDKAQISGATISYAKKYALANLFAIDGAKDSDAPDGDAAQQQGQQYQQYQQPQYQNQYGGYQ